FTDPGAPDMYALSLHDALPILLGLAWGATLLLRRHSASLRHMVRVFTLAALLLLPLSVLLLPAWHVKGVPDFTRRAAASVSPAADRKSTRLNSSHVKISYAVFC